MFQNSLQGTVSESAEQNLSAYTSHFLADCVVLAINEIILFYRVINAVFLESSFVDFDKSGR